MSCVPYGGFDLRKGEIAAAAAAAATASSSSSPVSLASSSTPSRPAREEDATTTTTHKTGNYDLYLRRATLSFLAVFQISGQVRAPPLPLVILKANKYPIEVPIHGQEKKEKYPS